MTTTTKREKERERKRKKERKTNCEMKKVVHDNLVYAEHRKKTFLCSHSNSREITRHLGCLDIQVNKTSNSSSNPELYSILFLIRKNQCNFEIHHIFMDTFNPLWNFV